MDAEIEDIVGDVNLTDSQKSVATSNVYSMDFTDGSSERNNSSGRETYVIDLDTSEDSETRFPLQRIKSTVTLKDKEVNISLKPVIPHRDVKTQYEITNKVNRTVSTSSNKCSIFAQENFTQTSKTIIELATFDLGGKNDTKTLETQTSLISVTENKTMKYSIEVNNENLHKFKSNISDKVDNNFTFTLNQTFNNTLEDISLKYPTSANENESTCDSVSFNSSEKLINILNVDSKEMDLSEERNENQYESTSDFENTDIEEDSLMEQSRQKINSEIIGDLSEIPKSVDNDIEDLYTKLSESIDVYSLEKPCETEKRKLSPLTTLTEESAFRENSPNIITNTINGTLSTDDKDVLFTNNEGMKIKLLPREVIRRRQFNELPAIRNRSCPNSPHLNFLFSAISTDARPLRSSIIEDNGEKIANRWKINSKDLAAGESISWKSDSYPETNYSVHLPPIHREGYVTNQRVNDVAHRVQGINRNITEHNPNTISIKNKIKELKMTEKLRDSIPLPGSSRSESPASTSPDEAKVCDLSERSCEALCVELLRQLHSSACYEISDTLENIPKLLEKLWGVITEQRIADLIRQIAVHVESPRTRIARSACATLASVLKNTNYTKKPDFYEAVTILLTKTGSFSRPIRRAANVALDDIVCGVDLTHAVTALCIHGVGHKSALVRCASARLLVVCCALAAGGRELLRSRPPTAACARRQALRSLAALLEDKNTDTRKYAERLYTILRPLPNFEAYFLTDVEVELASRQMKKYDQLLLCGAAKIR